MTTAITLFIIMTGRIVHYSDAYDMAAIAAYRGIELPAGYYGIATWNREYLGWRGTLTIDGTPWPVVVVDYTHPRDLSTVHERRIIAEVGYEHAALIPGLLADGKVPGTLYLARPGWREEWAHQPL